MSTDEILKTVLIVSISFSILVVSYQLARLLFEIRKAVNENRASVKEMSKNAAEVSKYAKDDYGKVRAVVGFASGPASTLKTLVDFGVAGKIFSFLRGKK